MTTIAAWLHDWSPWILGSLIPSLIVAFTKAPTQDGSQAWAMVKKLLQVLSILTHADEPGTLKPPLVTSAMGRRLTGVTATGPGPGAGAVLLLVGSHLLRAIFIAILLLAWAAIPAGCPHPTPGPAALDGGSTGIVQTLIDCNADGVRLHGPEVLPAVESILATGNLAPLEVLVAQYGIDVVACVVQRVGREASMQMQTAKSDSLASARASNSHAWLAQKQITFK